MSKDNDNPPSPDDSTVDPPEISPAPSPGAVSEPLLGTRSGLCTIILVLLGAGAFQLAATMPELRGLVVITLAIAYVLASSGKPFVKFWCGLLYGFAMYAPQLHWFLNIFGGYAILLWIAMGLWMALWFYAVAVVHRSKFIHHHRWLGCLAAAILWFGMEWLRSEFFFLRFSWLTTGFVIGPQPLSSIVGVYGWSFILMFLATLAMQHRWKLRLPILIAVVVGLTGSWMINRKIDTPRDHEAPKIVGIQLEIHDEEPFYLALESAIDLHPDTDIFVLCEGAFWKPPTWVGDWCKKNQVHLIAGAFDEIDRSLRLYYNSAFVWGPSGKIIFNQAKAQPVQFAEPWQPAESQECWQSPWGPIGIAICYDISFRRVMDVLVEQGAELLIIPAVDPISWGAYEHVLDARNTPIRAAEYGVPVIRVCSSGISQAVSPSGYEIATASFPGQGELLVAQLPMQAGSRPIDVLLALPAGLLFGIVIAFGMFTWLYSYIRR